MSFTWDNLLTSKRISRLDAQHATSPEEADAVERRTEWERDYDRILFSTPVRRLADKTQVFPLEIHDSVRTRLTHSHEVSNLARAMGTFLAYGFGHTHTIANAARILPPILAAVGLAHDLGNPPFGHQGERTIQQWFAKHSDIFDSCSVSKNDPERPQKQKDIGSLTQAMRNDFLKFEGNAQTFRLLTRLQTVTNDRGLNLTLATLAAVLKYPTSSDKTDDSHPATKKHGYFQSESGVISTVFEHTGLSQGKRHPLTWLMEACDDMAYLILDAEDAVKKGLVSVSDLFAFLEAEAPDDPQTRSLVEFGRNKHSEHRAYGLSPSELNDSTMQRFRVNTISIMVDATLNAFSKNYNNIIAGDHSSDLISCSSAKSLAKALRRFDFTHAYRHKSVLALELKGHNTIYTLMDMLWEGITSREKYDEPDSKRQTPFAQYVYSRISENYRRIFEGRTQSSKGLPIRYREAQLLTDMISGMTDNYVLALHAELEAFRSGPSGSK
ncbi:dNTP triphosphohydrolase [Pyxidicoccus fallax]|uniref:DNTP triphosphohydrolase n=1 Tax=Pyxidicoccus fallax TaxID=394095 RepID=A0A848LMQ0_9BACT|nr:dNTP triphosphohydrolase [Pyxidicoccus fallax]NMO18854.1 dNTP triphosphohydrolase [Pyxidicoccus fallax]NPC83779.1 dNTP triphosphohydrolase [Pyxidicoccus fallax]